MKAAVLAAAVVAGGLVTVAVVHAAPTTIQAETGRLSGGARVETEHPGYTGSGYVGGFTDGNRGSAALAFTVTGSGSNDLTFRYANGTGSARTLSLTVGSSTRQISLPATANWDTWGTVRQTATLSGSTTVTLAFGASDNGNANIDSLTVAPVTVAAGIHEAESAQLAGGTSAQTEHPGYTGSGYVGGFTDANKGNAAVTFAVSSSAAGTAPLTVRYANGTGSARTASLVVNGTTRQISLPATADWDTWGTSAESVALNSGSNSIAVRFGTADNGNFNLDNISVGAVAPPTTTTTPPPGGGNAHELEKAFLAGGASVSGGFVTGLTGGARVIASVNRSAAGTAATTLRYRNTSGSTRTLSVYANGLKQGQLSIPAGEGTVAKDLPLRSGLNLVGYQVDAGDSGGVDLDSVTVAGSSPLAGRGATLPYTTYDAENGATNGTVLAAGRTYTTEQAEASGRRAVKLTGTGQYVQITLTKPANAITVRASIPDIAGTVPLAVYAGGTKVGDLVLTAKYSWMYGAYPFADAPGGVNPHRFFDDARMLLPQTYPAGTVLKFAKDTAASAYITVDLIDAEVTDAPFTAPAGYVSVTTHGATPNDGNDDTAAFQAAVNAAKNASVKGVWIPAGTFRIGSLVTVAGVDVRGAGIWHTVLQGANRRGGFMVNGGTTQLGDFTFDGDVTTRDPDSAPNSDAAIEGDFGTGSLIHHIASNHAKVGLWVKGATNGLLATGLRLRNAMADGVNVNGTSTNVRVEQSTLRNTGDDALAMWSWNGNGGNVRNSVFAYNTVALPILANGAAIYGGDSNRIEDNVITDTVFQGSGITVSNWHDAAPFAGTTTVQRNTLTRTGTHSLDWGSDLGALWIYAPSTPLTGAIAFRDMEVNDSSHQGLLTSWQQSIANLTVDNVTFNGAGTIGMEFNTPGAGTFSNVTVADTGGAPLANNAGFVITRGQGNVGF